jgi:hypothetical protein
VPCSRSVAGVSNRRTVPPNAGESAVLGRRTHSNSASFRLLDCAVEFASPAEPVTLEGRGWRLLRWAIAGFGLVQTFGLASLVPRCASLSASEAGNYRLCFRPVKAADVSFIYRPRSCLRHVRSTGRGRGILACAGGFARGARDEILRGDQCALRRARAVRDSTGRKTTFSPEAGAAGLSLGTDAPGAHPFAQHEPMRLRRPRRDWRPCHATQATQPPTRVRTRRCWSQRGMGRKRVLN